MESRGVFLTILLVVLFLSAGLFATPTTPYEAEMVVTGWLKIDPAPLGMALGQEVKSVETFSDNQGKPIYYIVYLHPNGFVIVSADDLIEPIVGFVSDGVYESGSDRPLSALVTNDLKGRIAGVRKPQVNLLAISPQTNINKTQGKWNHLISLALDENDGLSLKEKPIRDNNPSDIRVSPMVQTKWGQTSYDDRSGEPKACYNYYTPPGEPGDPNNYPCGCVATAMAQLMRYHRYPEEPLELKQFVIDIDGKSRSRSLIGGDGPDGSYDWDAMVLQPGDGTTDEQRKAIGALCHDAGLASWMEYWPDGSGSTMVRAAEGLMETFLYSSAVRGENKGSTIEREDLTEMINPNLDAASPVILGIIDSTTAVAGHAVLCDGYGYNLTTLYHHLNMGWQGHEDCWYNLPFIETLEARDYDTIIQCIYNVFTHETGEIVSGRIVDTDDRPIQDATVTAQGESGDSPHTAVTNSNGIYVFKGLPSDSSYSITVDKLGFDFELKQVDTGKSRNGESKSGNRWGVDSIGYSNRVVATIGTGTSSWDYPMNTSHPQSRTQVIYLVDEIEDYGYINALALNIVEPVNHVIENWTIRMKHTNLVEYTDDSLDSSGWTVVYQNNERIESPGWRTFEFQTPFEYNGKDNLMVDFSYNGESYTEGPICKASIPGGTRSLYAYSNGGHGDPLDWSGDTMPSVFSSNRVPNVEITLCKESRVSRGALKLFASDGRLDNRFGCSVAISGDYAIIGAYRADYNRGSAYIFKRDGANWTEQTILELPDYERMPEDYFGISVSINGDYAIVGMNYEEHTRNEDAVCIYKLVGEDWVQLAKMGFEAYTPSYNLGPSVAISENYAIAGAMYYCPENVDKWAGGAYTFSRTDTNWIQQSIVWPSSLDSFVNFGNSVSISGNVTIIGSIGSCSAYIFECTNTGWTEQARLDASDSGSDGDFGQSVSTDGDFSIVGSPNHTHESVTSGSAYIFRRHEATWNQQAELLASDGESLDRFGHSVAINGQYAIVGAPEHNNGSNYGAAYIFRFNGINWENVAKLTPTDERGKSNFGCSVALDGNFAIVGADHGEGIGYRTGAVYIFRRIGSNWVQ